MDNELDRIMADVDRRRSKNAAEIATLTKLTGMTAAELDADLTAPDVPQECQHFERFPAGTVCHRLMINSPTCGKCEERG